MDNTAFTNNDAAAVPFELPDTSKISKAIEWINMAWRAIRGEQSADIIAWQQNNRVANARLAAVSDGIVNSQVQKSVNAFSEGLINTVKAPVQFIGAEYAAVTKYINKPKELNKSLTFMYGADSYQAQKLRKDFIKQDPAFALQYLSEIKQKPHILSQFQPQTQSLLQSEEFWKLTGRGERFEKWLQSELGASGNFKAGGKEFDGKVGNIWLEAKSGNFWNNLTPGSNELKTFKSKIGDAQRTAEANGCILQIHSDVRLPKHVMQYLDKMGIEYKIHTIFLEVEPCPKVLL